MASYNKAVKNSPSGAVFKPRARAIAWLITRLVIASAILSWIFTRRADLHLTLQQMAGATPAWVAAAFALALAGESVTAWKWTLLIREAGGRLPLVPAIRFSLIGMLYNNLLPGSIGGDLARVFLSAPYTGGRVKAAASTFMQRSTGLAGLLIVALIASYARPFYIPAWGAWAPPLGYTSFWVTLASISYVVAVIVIFSRPVYQLAWRWHHQDKKLPSLIARPLRAIASRVERFHVAVQGYLPYPPIPVIVSIATQIIDCTVVYCLARALGVDASPVFFLVAVPVATVVSLLPISLNGIGLREIVYLSMFASLGVAHETGTALGLMQFGIIISLSTIGALLNLRYWMVRPRQTPAE